MPGSDWFANYRRALGPIARIAEEEEAEALAIGTELAQTTQRPQWHDADRRNAAVSIPAACSTWRTMSRKPKPSPFWAELDAIGVTLYPPLGADDDRDGRRNAMRAVADRLDTLAARTGQTHRGRRDRAALGRGRRGEALGERRGTRGRCRSGASGASARGLACRPRSAVDSRAC